MLSERLPSWKILLESIIFTTHYNLYFLGFPKPSCSRNAFSFIPSVARSQNYSEIAWTQANKFDFSGLYSIRVLGKKVL